MKRQEVSKIQKIWFCSQHFLGNQTEHCPRDRERGGGLRNIPFFSCWGLWEESQGQERRRLIRNPWNLWWWRRTMNWIGKNPDLRYLRERDRKMERAWIEMEVNVLIAGREDREGVDITKAPLFPLSHSPIFLRRPKKIKASPVF